MEKTHWLQNPNKNYLGHWDLPSGKDAILTIKTVKWEVIKNPITNSQTDGRVIRFEENLKWVKPFICNQVNAQSIMRCTGEKFMEDCVGKKIQLGISQTKMYSKESNSMEQVDCLRVRNVASQTLQAPKINKDQLKELQDLIDKTDKTVQDICGAYKVDSLSDLNISAYENIIKRLNDMLNENN